MSKMALLFSVFSSLLINNAFAIPSSAYTAPSSFSWPATKNLLTFGDSYTYVQGTNGRQNYSFIGDVQHYRYNASTILSDHIVQNQTSTAEGGPNWVEFLTGCGLKPGLTDPKTCERRLWDFAFAGADVSVEFTPRHHHYTVMFVEQVRQFVKYGWPVLGKKGLVTPRETLVGVWIGINVSVKVRCEGSNEATDFSDRTSTTPTNTTSRSQLSTTPSSALSSPAWKPFTIWATATTCS